MPEPPMSCERCGRSLPPGNPSDPFARLCSACRAEAARSMERARVAEEEGVAFTEQVATDIDIAMLKEGK